MHFPVGDDRGYDLEFFRGLLSEKQMLVRRRGQNVITWEKVHERNEPLDCRNYARAAYKFFHWDFTKVEKILRGEDTEPTVTRNEAARKRTKRVISKGIQV